ncbi:unnamed protein product [Peronospora belbahrii]|uniref:Uncharacterized protein n=1 Tax=Peronospora belbahrii TaxID=622444 RepID=A0AAU9KZC7_9STRA|nr:unnamed protein product [Peronospora belbahrii]
MENSRRLTNHGLTGLELTVSSSYCWGPVDCNHVSSKIEGLCRRVKLKAALSIGCRVISYALCFTEALLIQKGWHFFCETFALEMTLALSGKDIRPRINVASEQGSL